MDQTRTEVTGESERTRAIRTDIDRTRREMSRTIDEIQFRLSPEHIKNNVRRAGVNTSRRFMDKVKDNPIPAAMVGVGLWLLFRGDDDEAAGFRPTRHAYDYESDFEESRLDEAKDRVRDMAESAREKTDELRAKTRRGVEETRDFLQDSPLIAGIAALAIGALIGGVIPESQKENELMGDTRDRLLNRTADAAKNAASDVAETAKERVRKTDVPQDLGLGR